MTSRKSFWLGMEGNEVGISWELTLPFETILH